KTRVRRAGPRAPAAGPPSTAGESAARGRHPGGALAGARRLAAVAGARAARARAPRRTISSRRGCRRAAPARARRGRRGPQPPNLFAGLVRAPPRPRSVARALHSAPLVRLFSCPRCDSVLFFENTVCTSCGQHVGYSVEARALVAVPADADRASRSFAAPAPRARTTRYLKCKNFSELDTCNWLVRASDRNPYCRSCRLTERIPGLGDARNRAALLEIERAKRR